MSNAFNSLPLVSVVITTYNYAVYLPRAIDSVLMQTYPNVEVIVIDDGSTDDAASVIPSHALVKYFYQENRGLSAARNNGIKKSKGDYVVFLDADDWLEPDAIENNLAVLIHHPTVAFISGSYYLFRVETGLVEEMKISVNDNHYIHFLKSNYIGMIAAVLFQRWALNEIQFDENLEACEDYDLYLNITRKYGVMHHEKFIATYYFHNKGLSHNYQSMMNSIAAVMHKQVANLHLAEESQAYEIGLQQWKDYHSLLIENMPKDII